MALIHCGECSREISSLATACPSCGAPNAALSPAPSPQSSGMGGGTKILLWLIGTPIVILVVMMVIGANISPAEKDRQTAGIAIDECDKQVNDELNPINVRRMARDVCDRLRSDYRVKYGHDY
ncbi:hypothetical protein ACLKMY_24855 [Paraburkholderia mimosarum]|uniref:hypothetical protein n=1 Tax=Paraburkholderia mimosarum TaxID=312026 RepID=UPI0039C005CD